jgi:LPS O-antigen subunit length determinant protein (WzzB/FepE family)
VPRDFQVVGDELRRPRVQGQVAELPAFAMHPQVQHPAPLVDVANFQRAELLASQSMVEQHREDGAIALPLERLGPRRIE